MASQPNAHAGILSHNAHTNGPSNPQDPLHLLPSASYGYAHLHKPQHNVTKVLLQPTTCTSKGHSATSLLTICTHGVSTFDPHNKVALKPQQDPHLFAHLPQTPLRNFSTKSSLCLASAPRKSTYIQPKLPPHPRMHTNLVPLPSQHSILKTCQHFPILTPRTSLSPTTKLRHHTSSATIMMIHTTHSTQKKNAPLTHHQLLLALHIQ